MNKRLARTLGGFLTAFALVTSTSSYAKADTVTPDSVTEATSESTVTTTNNVPKVTSEATSGNLSVSADTQAQYGVYRVLEYTKDGDTYKVAPSEQFREFFNNPNYGNYDVVGLRYIQGKEDSMRLASNLHKFIKEKGIKELDELHALPDQYRLGYYAMVPKFNENSQDQLSCTVLTSLPQINGDTWNYDVKVSPKINKIKVTNYLDGVEKDSDTRICSVGDLIKGQVKTTIPVSDLDNETSFRVNIYSTDGVKMKDEAIKVTVGGEVISEQSNTFSSETTPNTNSGENKVGNVTTISFNKDFINSHMGDELTIDYQLQAKEELGKDTHLISENPLTKGKVVFEKDSLSQEEPGAVSLAEVVYNPTVDRTVSGTQGSVSLKSSPQFIKTSDLELNVVDAKDKKTVLNGAKFQLENEHGDVVSRFTVSEDGTATEYHEGETVMTTEDGKVVFGGLGEGTYILKELATPDGYSKLADSLKIKISKQDDGTAKVEVLQGNEVLQVLDSGKLGSADLLKLQVLNAKGFKMPETGALGTQVFAEVALALLILAVALIYAKTKEA